MPSPRLPNPSTSSPGAAAGLVPALPVPSAALTSTAQGPTYGGAPPIRSAGTRATWEVPTSPVRHHSFALRLAVRPVAGAMSRVVLMERSGDVGLVVDSVPRRDGGLLPTVHLRVEHAPRGTMLEEQVRLDSDVPLALGRSTELLVLFDGDDLVLRQDGVTVGRRALRRANIPKGGGGSLTVGGPAVTIDGEPADFSGEVLSLEWWNVLPAAWEVIVSHERTVGTGAVASRYADWGGEKGPLGAPSAPEQPWGTGRLRCYHHGVVAWSPAYGCYVLTGAVKDWIAADPTAFLATHGLPVSDVLPLPSPLTSVTLFERTAVVSYTDPGGRSWILPRDVFRRYQALGGITGLPGRILEHAQNGPKERWRCAGCDLHKDPDLGIFEVHGAIRDRYATALFLGEPIADEASVRRAGGEVARIGRFERGAIVWSANHGAAVLEAAALAAWRNSGGAEGTLGLPTADAYRIDGSDWIAQMFERGALLRDGEATRVLTQVQLKLADVVDEPMDFSDEFLDDDAAEMYLYLTVVRNGETLVASARHPSGGYHQNKVDIGFATDLNLVDGARIAFTVRLMDADSSSADDPLVTWSLEFDRTKIVERMFGPGRDGAALEEHTLHSTREGGDFRLHYSLQHPPMPVDPEQFRRQGWWPDWKGQGAKTSNPMVADIHEYYGETYTDVTVVESWTEALLNPWDWAFGEAHRYWASRGSCFGMSVAALQSLRGTGYLNEWIYEFSSFESGNQVRRNVLTRHGYQIGDRHLSWVLQRVADGTAFDPLWGARRVVEQIEKGDGCVICLVNGSSWEGHAVLAYGTSTPGPGEAYRIRCADPNRPWREGPDGDVKDPHPSLLVVRDDGAFFGIGSLDGWTEDSAQLLGSFFFPTPYSVISSQPASPWSLFCGILEVGALLLLGDGVTEVECDGHVLIGPSLEGHPRLGSRFTTRKGLTLIPGMERGGRALVAGPEWSGNLRMRWAVGAPKTSVLSFGARGFGSVEVSGQTQDAAAPTCAREVRLARGHREDAAWSVTCVDGRPQTVEVRQLVLRDRTGRPAREVRATLYADAAQPASLSATSAGGAVQLASAPSPSGATIVLVAADGTTRTLAGLATEGGSIHLLGAAEPVGSELTAAVVTALGELVAHHGIR